MTNEEIRAIAEAALLDRLHITFASTGADAKGNTLIERIAAPTENELRWMALMQPRRKRAENLRTGES